jgi:REP element-mobilizing transposase RayT
MQQTEAFTKGNYYHVYNRGINGCDIFREDENYSYFLSLYDTHISKIAETYAWVLMPNHFHFLVRVKEDLTGFDADKDLTGFQNLSGLKPPHQYFSNLFNAYSKAFNKRFNRHGSLFERPFKRKKIDNMNYLRQVIIYIHQNPVHHHFCDHALEYPWSSYLSCISLKPSKLQRKMVIGWFDDEANFKYLHKGQVKIEEIEKLLGI